MIASAPLEKLAAGRYRLASPAPRLCTDMILYKSGWNNQWRVRHEGGVLWPGGFATLREAEDFTRQWLDAATN